MNKKSTFRKVANDYLTHTKNNKGITLIALIVTVIVLLILATVTLSLTLGNNNIFETAEKSTTEMKESQAKEEMALKLLEIEKESIIQKPESKLQFIADRLCEDDDIEYVLTSSQVASIDPIEVGDATKLYTKLKAYLYEFEIDSNVSIVEMKYINYEKTAVSRIEVTLEKPNIKVGESTKATVKVSPLIASNKSVTWSSGNQSIATVDEEGNVTAVGEGTTSIIATANDESGVIGSCEITCERVMVTNITVSLGSTNIKIGGTTKATVNVLPANAKDKSVTWSSGDESVATVNAQGNVTAVGEGTTSIIATAKDGSGVIGSCEITCERVIVTSIGVTLEKSILKVGNTTKATAKVLPANAEDKSITWSSEDKNIVTIDGEGNVKAVGVGNTNIIATANDGSRVTGSCEVQCGVYEDYPIGMVASVKGNTFHVVKESSSIQGDVTLLLHAYIGCELFSDAVTVAAG